MVITHTIFKLLLLLLLSRLFTPTVLDECSVNSWWMKMWTKEKAASDYKALDTSAGASRAWKISRSTDTKKRSHRAGKVYDNKTVKGYCWWQEGTDLLMHCCCHLFAVEVCEIPFGTPLTSFKHTFLCLKFTDGRFSGWFMGPKLYSSRLEKGKAACWVEKGGGYSRDKVQMTILISGAQ